MPPRPLLPRDDLYARLELSVDAPATIEPASGATSTPATRRRRGGARPPPRSDRAPDARRAGPPDPGRDAADRVRGVDRPLPVTGAVDEGRVGRAARPRAPPA